MRTPLAGDMPGRLTLHATLVLVALAFGAASAIQARLGGDSSAAEPAVEHGPAFVPNAPGLKIAKSLAPARRVPPLRDARTKTPSLLRVVSASPTVIPTPVMPAATMSPTPTASPPAIPPAPRYIPPTPSPTPAKPERTPTPTATPPDSGEFDTTGEP